MADVAVAAKVNVAFGTILGAAVSKAWRSGSAGFIAGTAQVIAFMWLRTVMNYQYKNGGSFGVVIGKLWAEGGVPRLYRGLFPWAIFQAPLSRFGDVASNEVILSLLGAYFPQLSVAVTTWAGSITSALFRVLITPIDTIKTTLQTDGSKGMELLKAKMAKNSFFVLWSGWEGNYISNVIGNYPWFVTMNLLQNNWAVPDTPAAKLVRSAAIGAIASSVSDVISNSIRVVKTKKQTAQNNEGYGQCISDIVKASGMYGLFFRGLETRIGTNVLQGAFFTVLWKLVAEKFNS
jgi:hypothetical protein